MDHIVYRVSKSRTRLSDFHFHTVKGFGVVNKAEVDVFLELFCFFKDPTDVGSWFSGSSMPFLNPAGTSGSSQFMYC